jgi:hypothetical protein
VTGCRDQPDRPWRLCAVAVLAMLTALVGLLALGSVTASSAAGLPDAGNRVGVSAPETITPSGPGSTFPQVRVGVHPAHTSELRWLPVLPQKPQLKDLHVLWRASRGPSTRSHLH